jgi:Phosphotransferase enzyme family
LPQSIKDVRIPKLMYSRVEREIVMMVQEYADGISSRHLSDESRRIAAYHKVVEFMGFVDAQLTPEERRDIPVRSVGSFMIAFPLIVSYALFKYPKRARQIGHATLGFVFSLPALVKNARLVSLCHNDLHFNNILLNEHGICVVDFEKCALTNPMYEYVVTLVANWRYTGFRDALIGEVTAQKRFRDVNALFRGLALYRGIHLMAGNYWPVSLDELTEFFATRPACGVKDSSPAESRTQG